MGDGGEKNEENIISSISCIYHSSAQMSGGQLAICQINSFPLSRSLLLKGQCCVLQSTLVYKCLFSLFHFLLMASEINQCTTSEANAKDSEGTVMVLCRSYQCFPGEAVIVSKNECAVTYFIKNNRYSAINYVKVSPY